MAESLHVTVFDPATGESSTSEVEPGNYMVICHEPCWLYGSRSYANGTTLLTIKGREKHLLGVIDLAARSLQDVVGLADAGREPEAVEGG